MTVETELKKNKEIIMGNGAKQDPISVICYLKVRSLISEGTHFVLSTPASSVKIYRHSHSNNNALKIKE